MRLGLILVGCTILAGCQSMNPEQCATADWQEIGRIDGRLGQNSRHVNLHRDVCEEVGTAVDLQRYEEGRKEGLNEFCSEAGAYDAGRKNFAYYDGLCPAELEVEFKKWYAAGRHLALLEKEREDTRAALEKKRKDIADDKSVLGDLSKAFHLLGGTSPTSDKEEKIEDLTDKIIVEKKAAPVSSLNLTPNVSVSGMASAVVGAAVGTVLGFGSGHAIQGHYLRDGWKWTPIDAGLFTSFAVLAANCPNERTPEGREIAAGCGKTFGPVVVLSFLGLRVWQSYELWKFAGQAFSPYSQAISKNKYAPTVTLTSPESGFGLLAAWGW